MTVMRDVIRLVTTGSIPPLITRCIADIEPQPVRWLWPGRIARGKVTVLAGHPGLGKSQLALDFGAIVTSRGRWPVDGTSAAPGSVIILSAEDDPADTIRPRLDAAGADLARCHIIEAAQDTANPRNARRRCFSLETDLDRLDDELQRIGDVALIIIDPITAYLGKIDSHQNAEVRALLAPLADLAAKQGAAVLAVSHLRKSFGGDAVLQVIGSLAFAAAARAVYIVVRDGEDPARRLLLPAKNNISVDDTGYAYHVEPVSLAGGIDTSRIAWEPGMVTITADQALAARGQTGGGAALPKLTGAARWLAEMLSRGPVPVIELQREAEDAGHSWSTVRRAHDSLRVTTEKTGFGGGWAWRLPGEETEL